MCTGNDAYFLKATIYENSILYAWAFSVISLDGSF